MSKCDVCGKEAETTVCMSSCCPINLNYCSECLNAGREPYGTLVDMGMCFNEISRSYREKILLPSLKFFGKTVDQFDENVRRLYEDDIKEERDNV